MKKLRFPTRRAIPKHRMGARPTGRHRLSMEKLEDRRMLASDLELIRDINTSTASSNPASFLSTAGSIYFTAQNKLWKTDGSASGTSVVKDPSGTLGNLVSHGSDLFFTVKDRSTAKSSLWKSNGTNQGTVQLSAAFYSISDSIVSAGNEVFFVSRPATSSKGELWKSDGTPLGTSFVHSITTGTTAPNIDDLTTFNDVLMFTANDGVNGHELWRSDGTTSGTYMVKDIESGSGSSYASELTVVGDTLFLSAHSSQSGQELWKSDGTESGTVLVKDIDPRITFSFPASSAPSQLVAHDGEIFFSAYDSTHGRELWRSDGTFTGTVLVKDITPGVMGTYPWSLISVGNNLFFTASDESNLNLLWHSDGSANGTGMVRDVDTDAIISVSGGIVDLGDFGLLQSPSGSNWRIEGIGSGAVALPVDLTNRQGNAMQRLSNKIVYAGMEDATGIEPWVYDLTTQQSQLIADLNTINLGSDGWIIYDFKGTAYFDAVVPSLGKELWSSDGTAAGTGLVVEASAGTSSSVVDVPYSSDEFFTWGDVLLFTLYSNADSNHQLWRTDSNGPVLLATFPGVLYDGGGTSRPYSFVEYNGEVYFSGTSGATGRELWKTDGTPQGTIEVKDLRPGTPSSHVFNAVVLGDALFFAAYGTQGWELWKSDGTSTGTQPFRDFDLAGVSAPSLQLIVINHALYFFVRTETQDVQLWKTDGSESGTQLLTNIVSAPAAHNLTGPLRVGDLLYFVSEGKKLWRSDGTDQGTFIVSTLIGSAEFRHLTAVGDQLYFVIPFGADQGLWTSNGTIGGTHLVSGNRSAKDLVGFGETLYFIESDQIWSSNGTDLTTNLIADFSAGSVKSLTIVGSDLMFFANDGVHGVEPWRIRLTSTIPDLSVANVVLSANAGMFADTTFDVSWEVSNQGQSPTNGTRVDRVYLSIDDQIDATDRVLVLHSDSAPLAIGESRGVTKSFTVPIDLELPPADYRLIVSIDDSRQIADSERANNQDSTNLLSLTLPPVPDVVIAEISIPASTYQGQAFPVSWLVQNLGDAAITGTWTDRVSLSSDNSVGDDKLVAEFVFTGTIAAGESVRREQSLVIGYDDVGFHWLIVDAVTYPGSNEIYLRDNNQTVSATHIDVVTPPLANLVVTEVIHSNELYSGQPTTVEWTVQNIGAGATDAAAWNDSVYLNSTPSKTGAILLGTSVNSAYLNPGESYRNRRTVTLPETIVGSVYLIVEANGSRHLFELNAYGDNVGAGFITEVIASPTPDLALTSVVSVDQAFSGETVQVTFDVTNLGNHWVGDQRNWFDHVWLSDESVRNERSILIARLPAQKLLHPGDAYRQSLSVVIPPDVFGDYHLVVGTDGWNDIYERESESNNWLSHPINIVLMPPPDLEVQVLTAPRNVQAGTNVAVHYRVSNYGASATPAFRWKDQLWFSTDTNLDPAMDQLLSSHVHAGILGIGQSYESVISGDLPADNFVDGYFIVVSNSEPAAFIEFDMANNAATPGFQTQVAGGLADLFVASLAAPAIVNGGEAILVDWTVTNQGLANAYVEQWEDRVILSLDPIAGNQDDRTIAKRTHHGALLKNENYSVNDLLVEIPLDLQAGDYFLFVHTNANSQVYEGGSGVATQNNRVTSVPIRIESITADLTVSSVTVPATGVAGAALPIEWTTRNIGFAATRATWWYDAVFLSTDQVLDANDLLLGKGRRTNPLAPGADYEQAQLFTLPDELLGNFYAIVVADRDQQVIEESGGLNLNNTTASAHPITISLSAVPDLSVVEVLAQDSAVAGQLMDVAWTVRNSGAADVVSGYWVDAVYLSKDQVFDPMQDRLLVTTATQTDLLINQQYTRNMQIELPSGIGGPYYVFVSVNERSTVFERDNRRNNIGHDTTAVMISVAPPVDLVAGAITVPDSAVPGQLMSVTYSVTNSGTNTVSGSWQDSLFISRDRSWSLDDALLGDVQVRWEDIPAGSSYTRTLTTALPGVLAGQYHVIVRSDIRNSIKESIETNNLSASLNSTSIDFPSLSIDHPQQITLNPGQQTFYRIDVPAGQTLRITMMSDGESGVTNGLYLANERVPSEADHDIAAVIPFSASQSLLVPSTRQGSYYLMIAADANSTALQSVQVVAERLEFSVAETSFGIGGNVGDLTLQINGAQFDPNLQAWLRSANGVFRKALRMWPVNEVRSYATFDLRGLAPGAYDVVVENQIGDRAIVAQGLSVVDAGQASTRAEIFAPGTTRRESPYAFSVTWENFGINDASSPLIAVHTGGLFGDFPGQGKYNSGHVFLGTAADDGPAGILRPGQSGSREFYGSPSGDVHEITVARPLKDSAATIDWDSFGPIIEPIQGGLGTGFDLLEHLRATVSDNRSLSTLLSELANLLPEELGEPTDLSDLLRLQSSRGLAWSGAYVDGKILPASFATQIANHRVQLVDSNGEIVARTISNTDGTFWLPALNPGMYEIVVASSGLAALTRVPITISSAVARTEVEVALQACGQLTGNIIDAHTSGVVGSAVIELFYQGDLFQTQVTHSSGRFRFDGLPEGDYFVLVRASGYALSQAVPTLAHLDGAAMQIPLARESGLRLAARDEQSGPISDFFIRLNPLELPEVFSVDQHVVGSQLMLGNLPAGRYSLVLYKNGFVQETYDSIELDHGQTKDLGDVVFRSGVSIRGVVNDYRTGVDFAPINVSLVDEATENAVAIMPVLNGIFQTVLPVPPGRYRLQVSDSTVVSNSLVIDGQAGETLSQLALAIRDGALISGHVTDLQQNPLVGTTVQLVYANGDQRSAVTDENGRYQFGELKLGDYRVSVQDSNFAVLVTVDDVSEVFAADSILVPILGSVSGTVFDANGIAIPNVAVQLFDGDRLVVAGQADASGRYLFRLTSLVANLSVLPIHDQYVFAARVVELEASPDSTLDFVPGSHSHRLLIGLSGSAESFSGDVRLLGPDQQLMMFEVSDTTEVILDHLVPGRYSISLDGRGRGASKVIVITELNSESRILLEATHSLTGRISDDASQALRGVIVRLTSLQDQQTHLTLTDGDGNYLFQAVPSGDYLVEAIGPGVARQEIGMVSIGGPSTAEFSVVSSNVGYAGRLIDSAGKPVSGATVIAFDSAGNVIGLANSDASGAYFVAVEREIVARVRISVGGYATGEIVILPAQRASGTIEDSVLSLLAIAVVADPSQTETAPLFAASFGGQGEGIGDWAQNAFFGLIDVLVDGALSIGAPASMVSDGDLLNPPIDCGAWCLSNWRQASKAIKAQNDAYERFRDQARAYTGSWFGYFFTATELITDMISDAGTLFSPVLKLGRGIQAIEKLLSSTHRANLLKLGLDLYKLVDQLSKDTSRITHADSVQDGIYVSEDAFQTLSNAGNTVQSIYEVLNHYYPHLGKLNVPFEIFSDVFSAFDAIGTLFKIIDTYGERFEKLRVVLAEMRELEEIARRSEMKLKDAIEVARRLTDESNACVAIVFSDFERYCKREEIPQDEDDRERVRFVRSMDPNDIIGPEGFGAERWVSILDTLAYRIRFENDPELATAPAQTVTITQSLDTDLDLRTFRLGNLGFGETVVTVPENRSFFATRLDLTESIGIFVDLFAGIDFMTGNAFWKFTSVDPSTGRRPQNPLIGFLPPNLMAPEGDGFVTYSIAPKSGTVTGTLVTAKAAIVFDENSPIETPEVFNTIDARAPQSGIITPATASALAGEFPESEQISAFTNSGETASSLLMSDGTFNVRWSGLDDDSGSAIAFYTIYVSTDHQPYTIWLDQTNLTQAPFVGQPGHTYAFYSVATDLSGLVQSAPTAPQWVVSVPADPGVVVTSSQPLATSEAGDVVRLQVRLRSLPTDDVTLSISVSDLTEASLATPVLFFNSSNWDLPQVVEVTGVDDLLIDGDTWFEIRFDASLSAAAEYAISQIDVISVVNLDDDGWAKIEGIVWNDSDFDGVRSVGESRQSQTSVRLFTAGGQLLREATTAIDGRYSFSMIAPNESYRLQVQVPPTRGLTRFAEGVDDVFDSDFSEVDDHTELFQPAAGETLWFDAGMIDLAGFSGRIWDDADGDGVFDTEEIPLAQRRIYLDQNADGTWTIGEPFQWSASDGRFQFEKVHPGEYDIIHELPFGWTATTHLGRLNLLPGEHRVLADSGSRQDRRDQLFTIQQRGALTDEAGRGVEFQISLNVQPSSPFTMDLAMDNPSEFSLSQPTIVFDANNWNLPQSVFVYGKDDLVADGNQFGRLRLMTSQTADHPFANWQIDSTLMTNLDNEIATLVITQTNGNTFVSENGLADQFSVRLSAKPTDQVVIDLSRLFTSDAVIVPSQLIFDPQNWDHPQDVVLDFGFPIEISDSLKSELYLSVSAATGDLAFSSMPMIEFSLVVMDQENHLLQLQSDNVSYQLIDLVSGAVILQRPMPLDNEIVFGGPGNDKIQVAASINQNFHLRLSTGEGNDVIEVQDPAFTDIDGGSGVDTLALRYFATHSVVNFGLWSLENIETIDVRSQGQETIVLNASDARMLVGNGTTLDIYADAIDSMRMGSDWTLNGRGLSESQPFHRLVAAGIELRLFDASPWTNPLQAEDVNADHRVSVLDALEIINWLGRQQSGGPELSDLLLTTNRYWDVNDNNQITALDALRVINYLGRQMVLTGEAVSDDSLTLNPRTVLPMNFAVHAGNDNGTGSSQWTDSFREEDPGLILTNRQRFDISLDSKLTSVAADTVLSVFDDDDSSLASSIDAVFADLAEEIGEYSLKPSL